MNFGSFADVCDSGAYAEFDPSFDPENLEDPTFHHAISISEHALLTPNSASVREPSPASAPLQQKEDQTGRAATSAPSCATPSITSAGRGSEGAVSHNAPPGVPDEVVNAFLQQVDQAIHPPSRRDRRSLHNNVKQLSEWRNKLEQKQASLAHALQQLKSEQNQKQEGLKHALQQLATGLEQEAKERRAGEASLLSKHDQLRTSVLEYLKPTRDGSPGSSGHENGE